MKDILDVLKATWPEWEIVSKLGSGSYGDVFKVRKQDLAGVSYAAIKTCVIPRDAQELEERRAEQMSVQQISTYYQGIAKNYTAEIQLMDAVKGCTNIVAIDDYKIIHYEDEPFWYILIRMELLTPLMKVLEKQRMSEEDIVKLGIDLCTALDICGKKNIVHRDIKPDNIFINEFGSYKLGDFGVARRLEQSTLHLTRQGTPYYMAPEIYNSITGAVDFAAASKVDIYSLGMVLYWLANGNRHAFMPQDHSLDSPNVRTESLIRRVKGEALPPPRNVSKWLQDVILKACAYKPEDRFASADEMRRALMRQTPVTPPTQTPPPAPPAPPAPPTPPPAAPASPAPGPEPEKRKGNAAVKIVGILAALVAVGSLAFIGSRLILKPTPTPTPTPIIETPAPEPLPEPEPTPTASPTPTPTKTPTPTPTKSPTPTPTKSPTPTPTKSPTPTPTKSPTPTPTKTPTPTPTKSPTPTTTKSPTPTPTPTPTKTPTPTPTKTPTPTPTKTPTPTPTKTPTPTPTKTPTPTPTKSPTPT
ncbi:MAG: serine/threonine protein kinase, partial [Clostridia bacterium]|nr:serine/threonine protein kinase [Clostridia bacterium]